MFPEDYQISKIELIECWIGESFLKENDGINGVHNQGYYIIGVLVHACLLEEAGSDYVKLHDVIRDMTLWIACEVENENFLVKKISLFLGFLLDPFGGNKNLLKTKLIFFFY